MAPISQIAPAVPWSILPILCTVFFRAEHLLGLALYADVTPFLLTSSLQEKKLILEVKRAAKLGNQVGLPPRPLALSEERV